MEKTFFVSFEGIDGSGKDTQLNRFIDLIKENNDIFGDKYSNIWITREPTKITDSGIKMSELLKGGEVSKEITTKLYIQDRCEHTILIKDILKHSHVLVSRYDISTLSYQMTQGMDFDDLYELHNYGKNDGCIIPDITIVFNLDVDLAFERMSTRDETVEFFENKKFQTKLKENLDYVVDKLREKDGRCIIVVDSSKTIDEVTKEMYEKIKNSMKLFS